MAIKARGREDNTEQENPNPEEQENPNPEEQNDDPVEWDDHADIAVEEEAEDHPIIADANGVSRLGIGDHFYAAFAHNPTPGHSDVIHAKNNLAALKSGTISRRSIPREYWHGDLSKPPLARRTHAGWEFIV